MSIQTIFLDVDGVLADFHGSLYAALGISDPYRNPAFLGEYRLEKVIDLPREEILRPCFAEEFWRRLPKTPDADDVVRMAEKEVGEKNVYFLTASTASPSAYGGRAHWVDKHYPRYFSRLIIAAEKHWLAAPGRLLVDDCDDNVNAWRAGGGEAILIPQSWNSQYERKQMSYGYCPICNVPGVRRERRLDGNDTCANGHVYPSKDAVPKLKRLDPNVSIWPPSYTDPGGLRLTGADWNELVTRVEMLEHRLTNNTTLNPRVEELERICDVPTSGDQIKPVALPPEFLREGERQMLGKVISKPGAVVEVRAYRFPTWVRKAMNKAIKSVRKA